MCRKIFKNGNKNFSCPYIIFPSKNIHNLLFLNTGEDLVAVVGSDSVNSKGMEVWNPADESLNTFHEELPHEQVVILNTIKCTFSMKHYTF